MSKEKNILIITDDSEQTSDIAKKIASNLDGLNGNKVLIKAASGFAGTDLLACDILFIGCDEPSPLSFTYLEEMLKHINLAGRSGSIFSASKKAVKYLSNLIKDSEIRLKAKPLLIDSSSDISEWAARVIG